MLDEVFLFQLVGLPRIQLDGLEVVVLCLCVDLPVFASFLGAVAPLFSVRWSWFIVVEVYVGVVESFGIRVFSEEGS